MWAVLIEAIDYHHKVWYERDDNGDWQRISMWRACAVFDELAPGLDHQDLIRKFKYRDREARARKT